MRNTVKPLPRFAFSDVNHDLDYHQNLITCTSGHISSHKKHHPVSLLDHDPFPLTLRSRQRRGLWSGSLPQCSRFFLFPCQIRIIIRFEYHCISILTVQFGLLFWLDNLSVWAGMNIEIHAQNNTLYLVIVSELFSGHWIAWQGLPDCRTFVN